MTSKNLTCTATISKEGVEFIEFHYGGGTKNEFFLEHFEVLSKTMLYKYPNKKLIFILDNLWFIYLIKIVHLLGLINLL